MPAGPLDRVLHSLIRRVGPTAAAEVVLGQQPLLDVLIEPVKVDVGKDGRCDPALRGAAERGVPPPVLQVPGLEHVADQPQEPAIADLLRQDLDHYFMIQRPEAVGDIALDEPVRPLPDLNHLAQRGVAAPGRAETWGTAVEPGLDVRAPRLTPDLVALV